MITVKDIMGIYKVSQATVYNWIYEGMPRYKIGRSVRFDQAEVDNWVRNEKGVKN